MRATLTEGARKNATMGKLGAGKIKLLHLKAEIIFFNFVSNHCSSSNLKFYTYVKLLVSE